MMDLHFVQLNMLNSEYKILIKTLWKCENISCKKTDQSFVIRTGKDKHRNTLCKSFEQPV